MLLWIYNILQLVLLPFAPACLLVLLLRKRYRHTLPARLGLGLGLPRDGSPRIWIHALSVGEVNAASPLVHGIRKTWPEALLVCSATTATGMQAMESTARRTGGTAIPSPIDCYPVARRFARVVRPDCFILVETDLWPNWLWQMRRLGARLLLVNGSISARAARRLKRLPWAARLLYGPFDLIVAQSRDDLDRLSMLGIPGEKLLFVGNLKYDVSVPSKDGKARLELKRAYGLESSGFLWVAGSTHPGEEEVILDAHLRARRGFQGLQLLVAPRDPGRGEEVANMARERGLSARRRTQGQVDERIDVLVLDTLGELAGCYAMGDVAFVGGTLVPVGGHNLLEPACHGVPVLFGPHVESCRETALELELRRGGAMVRSGTELAVALEELLRRPEKRERMACSARALVEDNRGAMDRHLDLVAGLLDKRGGRGE